jgi:hypothetical protein
MSRGIVPRINLLKKSSIFWDITPCRSLSTDGSEEHVATDSKHSPMPATCFMLVYSLAYHSALQIEATCSSETSVNFQRTTRRYIPEGRTLYNHRCENLNSYKAFGTIWRSNGKLHASTALYSGKSPQYPLVTFLGESHNRSNGMPKSLCLSRKSNAGRPPRSLFIILTELPWMHSMHFSFYNSDYFYNNRFT